ncbi:MAG: carboxypeptidase-like regulatory domain-containing protein, partial [Rikenellaceae bacterium]|nr:carboxypeptidase-like regulatory domain-containing protein [Rikenellaceae bacterium]
MNTTKLFAIIAAFVMVPMVALAQHDHSHSHQHSHSKDAHITGHVVDATTGQHLPYITISIDGTQKASLTDASGHFSL